MTDANKKSILDWIKRPISFADVLNFSIAKTNAMVDRKNLADSVRYYHQEDKKLMLTILNNIR